MARESRHPQASWAWFQVGSLREEAGQVKPAIEAFGKVTGDDKAQAYFRAGRLWEGLKNRAQARTVYEKLIPLRPANDASRLHGLLRLGLLYELDSKAKKAMPLYKEVARLGTGTIAQTASNRLK
jgi:tetratricopeptide (TPR) repeat protein